MKIILKSKKLLDFLVEQKIFIILILLVILLSFATEYFLTYSNIQNILFQMSVNGIIAIGMTFLIISRELDLSVGSSMSLVGVIVVISLKYGIIPSIILGIITGLFIGLINGLLVARLKLNSVAMTLGMSIILQGIVLFLTKSQTIKAENQSFYLLAHGSIFKIQYPIIIFVVFLIIFGFLLSRSIFGRNLYALGGNPEASALFGIPIDRLKILSFVLTGFFVGVAGVIQTAKLEIASSQLGIDTPIDVIITVLIGGTSLAGGEGSIFKTFQGVLLMGVISNALIHLQIMPYYHSVIKGLLLIIVLVIDSVYIKYKKFRFA